MRRAIFAVRRAESQNGNFGLFVEQALIVLTFFFDSGRVKNDFRQFDRRMREQIVNMPTELFLFPVVAGDPCSKIFHRAARVNVFALRETAQPQCADLQGDVLGDFDF
jgi:hypothetical protein